MTDRHPAKLLLPGFALGLLMIAWPAAGAARAAAPATVKRPPNQVMISGTVDVPKGTSVGAIVVFQGNVTVEGVAEGDVVVLHGPVTVSGRVNGSVVALRGGVTLRSTAVVAGDVVTDETVVKASGAKVGGTIRHNLPLTFAGPLVGLATILGGLMVAVSTFLLGLVLLWIAPRGADRIAETAKVAPMAAALWGLLIWIALPALGVLAMATVLGFPLGMTVLLALALLFLVGFTWTVWALGRAIIRPPRSRIGAFVAGWAIASVVGFIPSLDVAVWILASIFGLGAMSRAIWRWRHETGSQPTVGLAPQSSEFAAAAPAQRRAPAQARPTAVTAPPAAAEPAAIAVAPAAATPPAATPPPMPHGESVLPTPAADQPAEGDEVPGA